MSAGKIDPDPFYVGYLPQAPAPLGAFTRKVVAALVVAAAATAAVSALFQRDPGAALFDYGNLQTFEGFLVEAPYPHLRVDGGGEDGAAPVTGAPATPPRRIPLVAPFKHGFPEELARQHGGRRVTLQGTLIERDGTQMVEAVPGSVERAGMEVLDPGAPEDLGQHTLRGEIVDSKCYLGVMNPGVLKPHRACAVQCIRGGIPPLLLVRVGDGTTLQALLVAADGSAVNEQVLDLVARPVEITGTVTRYDNLLVLRADPSTYRLLEGEGE